MSKHFIIGIVLYQPTKTSIARIRQIALSGYTIILFDNSFIEINDFQNFNNIIYFHSTDNVGLSGGIDFIAKKANDLKYYSLLNFDQDTIFTTKTLLFIEEVISKYIVSERLGSNLITVGFRDFNKTGTNQIISYQNLLYNSSEVDFTINSGSLYLLKFYNNFKWFDKKYFVDGLDYSFCLQSNKHGYKIIECYATPDLNHRTEQDDTILKIFNLKIRGRKYLFKRNKDFIYSHIKLLIQSIVNIQTRHFIFLFKSLMIYCITQSLFYFKKTNN